MSSSAEITGRLYEAIEAVKMARLKIDGAKCLMQMSGQFNKDDYLRTEAEEIDINLWAELHNLRELAQKCDR